MASVIASATPRILAIFLATSLTVFAIVDCIALESNYDTQMQADSGPVRGSSSAASHAGNGHLSNVQAFAAIRKLVDSAHQLPDHIVLLHRSQECNCPDIVRRLFGTDQRIASRLTLAEQHERSPWLGRMERHPNVGQQLMFAF